VLRNRSTIIGFVVNVCGRVDRQSQKPSSGLPTPIHNSQCSVEPFAEPGSHAPGDISAIKLHWLPGIWKMGTMYLLRCHGKGFAQNIVTVGVLGRIVKL